MCVMYTTKWAESACPRLVGIAARALAQSAIERLCEPSRVKSIGLQRSWAEPRQTHTHTDVLTTSQASLKNTRSGTYIYTHVIIKGGPLGFTS